MKKLLIILFVFATLSSISQTKRILQICPPSYHCTTYRPHPNYQYQSISKYILKTAEKLVGIKIGDGSCNTLVREIEKKYYPCYRKKIKRKDVKPGDIILYYYKNSRIWGGRKVGHIGIVYKIINKNRYFIYNQNVLEAGERTYDTAVEITCVDLSRQYYLKVYSIKFYRIMFGKSLSG